jgi:hypothetical protein
MRQPAFTETLQIGIVVRDLEATMRRYVDDYGIGPWEIYEFNPGNAKDLLEYGQPVERSFLQRHARHRPRAGRDEQPHDPAA